MEKQKKILIPTDFSESAFNAMRYAIQFAATYNGQFSIDLLHVIYPEVEPTDYPSLSQNATIQKLEWAKANLEKFAETSINQIKEKQALSFVPKIEYSVEIGAPSSTVSHVTKRDGIDLVIMGTEGEDSALDKLFGTTSSTTLAKSKIPILVIPEKAALGKVMTMAYATDLSKTDPYHIWEMSKFLAPFNPIIRVVHIAPRNSSEQHALDMKNLEDFFKDQVPGLQITFHDIAADHVIEGLKEFSKTWEVSILIMHRKHRGFIEQLFHESMTKKAILHPFVPTLIVPERE